MHHKSLYRLGLLMLLAGLASNACTLEEVKEYEDSCPGLQYIQTDYGKLICSGEPDPTCKLEGVDSECPDEECHALMNGKYKEAFLYEICPSGYKCNSNHDEGFCYPDKLQECADNQYYSSTTNQCEPSTVNFCGSETNDCTAILGWSDGTCENSKCIVSACEKGFTLKDNACVSSCGANEYYSSTTNQCEPSTVNFCGSETNDCTQILGWSDGTCENNKCIVSSCTTGFALKDNACVSSCGANEYYSGTTNQCEPSSVNRCGSETNDCTQILGWSDGTCENNKCIVSSCTTGFALKDNACVSSCSANEYYSSTTSKCEASTVNFCGLETNDCTQILGWSDGTCENNKCVISECTTGFALKDNACVSSCKANEYYSSTTNQCEASTVNFCGSETNDCTKLANWADGKCENNKCIVESCATGYKVKDNSCVSDCTNTQYYSSTSNQCESSTVNFCGSETNDCTKLANWADGKCENNKCIITKCATGYKVKDNSCVSDCTNTQYYSSTTNQCEPSTVNRCGSETNDCKTSITNWAEGKCEANKCTVTKCATGYKVKDNACVSDCTNTQYYSSTTNQCETSTVNKCGSETNDCTKAAGWAGGSCESNVCKATACEIGYNLVNGACKAITSCGTNQYYYNGSCHTSTIYKCGSETNDCTKAAGWADGSCASNVCKATKCETGYNLVNGSCKAITSCATNEYYYNGSCVTSTIYKCGSETNDCTKLAGWANGTCTSNVCKATACKTGYVVQSGVCVAGCPAGQTKVSCLGDCYHEYMIKDYLHMNSYCKCLDNFMNDDGNWVNGCETCDYENGFKKIGDVCKKVCDGTFGGNYYCAAKEACCSGQQGCEESGQGQCEYL